MKMVMTLIVKFLLLFSTVFQLYRSGQCTYPCFPGVLLTSNPHDILSKPLVTFPITIVETTDSSERGMNPVIMTIINGRARDRTSDLLFSSEQCYELSYGARLKPTQKEANHWPLFFFQQLQYKQLSYMMYSRNHLNHVLICMSRNSGTIEHEKQLVLPIDLYVLTHYRTINFRLFHTERVCRQQFHI